MCTGGGGGGGEFSSTQLQTTENAEDTLDTENTEATIDTEYIYRECINYSIEDMECTLTTKN